MPLNQNETSPMSSSSLNTLKVRFFALPLSLRIFFLIVVVGGLSILSFFVFQRTKNVPVEIPEPGVRISENLTLPNTQVIANSAGRIPTTGTHPVSLTPQNEEEMVVVPNAILTINTALERMRPRALSWAPDAGLVYIKSEGTVTLLGKSSQWQIAYASSTKNMGHEIIVRGDKIVSEKDVALEASGGSLTPEGRRIGEVISEIRTNATYKDATLTAAALYYNADSKKFRYVLGTSKGVVSISL